MTYFPLTIHRKPPVDLAAKQGIVCMQPNGDILQLELTRGVIDSRKRHCDVTTFEILNFLKEIVKMIYHFDSL